MKHVLRILAVPVFLALFVSCESSVTEAPQDTSTEIEALLRTDWGEERLVLITSVPDYLARFEWDNSGHLSDGRRWGVADAGEFLERYIKMQIRTTYRHDRQDSYRTLAIPECTMKKGTNSLGLEDFADCIQYVNESCDTVMYIDSEDGKTLEAHGINVTYNDDNTATAVPCNPIYR
ncbi:MAG: hypothetical protein F4Y90_01545 [Rhodothermaceae bacterium]|nr:hypothetical protein [Rhodothermaceae bacterium]MYF41451.1 hypothetical protein [Rhodothermaceae bacterium]